MKLCKKIFVVLALVFSINLAACKTHLDGSSPVNSSATNAITEWSNATKVLMEEVLGELIPVAPVSINYSATLEEIEGLAVIYLVDATCGNIVPEYSTILAQANYESLYDEEFEDYAYYYKFLDEIFSLDIEFGFDEEGFYLLASIFDNSYEMITDWYAEDKSIMTAVIGEVLPLAPLTTEYGFYLDTDAGDYYFAIYDFVAFEELYDYGVLLESAGFEFDSNEETDEYYGEYYVKEHSTLDAEIWIDLFFENDGSFTLYGYLVGEQLMVDAPIEYEAITEWNANATSLMQSLLGQTIPLAPLSTSYTIIADEDDEGYFITIEDAACGDITDAYSAILEAEEYELYDYDDGYAYYYKDLDSASSLDIVMEFYEGVQYIFAFIFLY